MEQKYLVDVVGPILNFLIINWSDDIIPQVDDVTFLVKKRFFLLLRCFYQFEVIAYILIF